MSTGFDQHVRQRFAGRAEVYASSFGHLCGYPAGALLDAAGTGPGVRLLDAGTGPGTVAALACARGATVTAADPEPSMVDLARRNAPEAEVVPGTLPDLPFPGERFDVAVANFVVHHVGDPGAAVAELRRVVRPGGRVAVTVWPVPRPPLQALWHEIIDEAGLAAPDIPVIAPELDFERTPDGFARLLREAGLREVSCQTITWEHRTDPEEWWVGPVNGIGALGSALLGRDPETVARTRRCYDRLIARYLTDDGHLALPTAALLATGIR